MTKKSVANGITRIVKNDLCRIYTGPTVKITSDELYSQRMFTFLYEKLITKLKTNASYRASFTEQFKHAAKIAKLWQTSAKYTKYAALNFVINPILQPTQFGIPWFIRIKILKRINSFIEDKSMKLYIPKEDE